MTTLKIPAEVIDIFPYDDIRPIQDELISTIYSALKAKKNVVIEGANGLGKTVAALTACIPIARERNLQIIHVCRTNKQADRVISELKEIAKETDVSGLSIRGRREMCPHPIIEKHADDAATASVLCNQLKKLKKCEYHNRMDEKSPNFRNVMKILEGVPSTSTEINNLCRENRLCSYELILKLVEKVDVVAASYQYLFNPPIRDIFLNKVNRSMSELLLIVDECHNIIDASLSISSDQLSIFSLRQALKEIKAFNYPQFLRLVRALTSVLEEEQVRSDVEKKIDARAILLKVSREIGATIDLDYVDKLISAGMKIQRENLSRNKPPRSYIHRIGQFLRRFVLTKSRTEFLHLITSYRTRMDGWSVRFEVVSLDARFTTKHVLEYVSNSVHISGTIEPIDSYSKIVGLDKLPLEAKVLDSPYSEKNVQGYVIDRISTRLADRTPENYKKMCEIIGEAANNTPSNSGIFTASYVVLKGLLDAGVESYLDKPFFYEQRKMTSSANDRLINEYKSLSTRGGAVLMGVLGGRSSEGADFPGKQMNTCIIAGIPYARPTTRIESQIGYLEEHFPKKGREYGYVIPAIRRASQAAGRPIRSINDRGLIIFLDYRFGQSYTARFLPAWLRQNTRPLQYEPGRIATIAEEFFS
ncbi:MAG: helicase C-terminal domain-containing protein [Candidatus Heimdallarchaeota archaeon]